MSEEAIAPERGPDTKEKGNPFETGDRVSARFVQWFDAVVLECSADGSSFSVRCVSHGEQHALPRVSAHPQMRALISSSILVRNALDAGMRTAMRDR